MVKKPTICKDSPLFFSENQKTGLTRVVVTLSFKSLAEPEAAG